LDFGRGGGPKKAAALINILYIKFPRFGFLAGEDNWIATIRQLKTACYLSKKISCYKEETLLNVKYFLSSSIRRKSVNYKTDSYKYYSRTEVMVSTFGKLSPKLR
jgi:hypothetical protein